MNFHYYIDPDILFDIEIGLLCIMNSFRWKLASDSGKTGPLLDENEIRLSSSAAVLGDPKLSCSASAELSSEIDSASKSMAVGNGGLPSREVWLPVLLWDAPDWDRVRGRGAILFDASAVYS
jgi:hypothetical protein